MAVMAWDVGIKNLAYCIIRSETDILDWDIINISGCSKITCCGQTKAKKVCGKAASVYIDEDHGYCETHKSQASSVWSDDMVEELFSVCTGYCEYVNTKGVKCTAKAKRYHDIKYCGTHAKAEMKRVCANRGVKPVKSRVQGKIPTQELQINLFRILDAKLDQFIEYGVKHVYIENQPSLVNPKMKALACSLMDYFLLRSKIDLKIDISIVSFISPNTKLALIPDAKAKIKAAGKDKYAVTKKLTVDDTIATLKDNKHALAIFESFKPKQDDAADAYEFARVMFKQLDK